MQRLTPPKMIAIIGGGPAGLIAAQHLAEAGHTVRLYEAQATVGRKFLVAGHGGFNLSNAEGDAAQFAGRYGAAARPFGQFLNHFSPADLRAWATDLGIVTFVGSSGRIFPEAAHKPADLLRAWLPRLRGLGVEVCTRHRWLGFADDGRGLLLQDETAAPARPFTLVPQATLLALGGASWPKTGSDGAWGPLLSVIGVGLTPFAPSNCGAEVAWSAFFRDKVGRAPLKNIALTYGPHTVRGELMLTDYGLEGTPVYALTPALRTALAAAAAGGPPAALHLNLKPDLTPEQLLRKVLQRRAGTSLPNFLANALHLPAPVPTLLRELLPPGTALPEGPALAACLARLPLPISGLRPLAEAISTAGGIPFAEVDEHLMLRRRPGTFVAGEMLDWEAPTGGYLLQGCFSTGAWAARGMAMWQETASTKELLS